MKYIQYIKLQVSKDISIYRERERAASPTIAHLSIYLQTVLISPDFTKNMPLRS